MGSYPPVMHTIEAIQQDITNMCDVLIDIDQVSTETAEIQNCVEHRLDVDEEKIQSLLIQNNELTEELNKLKGKHADVVDALNSAIERINDIHRWMVFKFMAEDNDKDEQDLKCYESINFDDLSDIDENGQ